jgi:hypothetical protein
VNHAPSEQSSGWTELYLSDIPGSFREEDHFESPVVGDGAGRIVLCLGGISTGWLVVSGDDMGNAGYVVVKVPYDPNLTGFVGGMFWLEDDDHLPLKCQCPQREYPPISLPHTLDLGCLEGTMEEAFVVVCTYDQQSNSPFVVNVEDVDAAVEANMAAYPSQPWWCVHITAAFQGQHSRDRDDYREPVLLGVSDNDVSGTGEGALVYLECIREEAVVHGIEPRLVEAENVAHEVGHLFGLGHHTWQGKKYLMAGEDQLGNNPLRDYNAFCPQCIRDIRATTSPPH